MGTDLLYFQFKGEPIGLKEVDSICETSSQNRQEFKAIIDNYNLKYSFRGISEANRDDAKLIPLSLSYKGSDIHLLEFIEKHNEFHRSLPLLDRINGLEIHHLLSNIINCHDNEANIVFIETSRLFQALYNTFTAARYALTKGELKLHTSNEMPWNNGSRAQFWLRKMYLNNAIIWYNSSFDILLQCLWIGKRLFTQSTKGDNDRIKYSLDYIIANREKIIKKCDDVSKSLPDLFRVADIGNKKTMGEILKKCSLTPFEGKDEYKFLGTFRNSTKIPKWANDLKHKNGLQYKEDYSFSGGVLKSGAYDSHETLSLIEIDEVVEELAKYHKGIISVVNKTYEVIQAEFKQYNCNI